MGSILVFLITAVVLAVTAAYIYRLRSLDRLTPGRFSIVFSVGWTAALLIFYFAGLSLGADIKLSTELVLLGLGIVLLNLLIALPVSFLLYKYGLERLISKGESQGD